METTTSEPVAEPREATLPYPPSIIDRWMRFVQRLPLPYWLTYLLLFLLVVLLHHLLDWTDGSVPPFRFFPLDCFYPLLLCGSPAIMTYLDGAARKALRRFSPLLDVPPETLQRLEYEFTTMPPRGMLMRTVFWTIQYAIFILAFYIPVMVPRLHSTPPTVAFALVLGFLAFNNGLFYHTMRQLVLVNRTVRLVKHFDLFRLVAVYAFSQLTARTGIALLLLLSLMLLIVPVQLTLVPLLVFQGAGIILALAAFGLPLWFVHERLVAEKRGLLAAHAQRVKEALRRLHHAVDDNEMGDAPQLGSVLNGLNIEGGFLEKIHTWPWSNGTLTAFLTAIVLPLISLLLQLVVQKWLKL